jgi:hypothetical protein
MCEIFSKYDVDSIVARVKRGDVTKIIASPLVVGDPFDTGDTLDIPYGAEPHELQHIIVVWLGERPHGAIVACCA